ncbi:hypothetical protein PVAND_015341 [Polypedilum vanderplanki]|uniref:Glycosyltransferase family 92 protein n=1 Tax=Polypedilum vanderplanki TaxID=319348 RepID=A0A9J6BCR5_POLVA|nr:hypothetical protein PVAND_015341 [Polypedilum vanderplanki]
MNTSRSIQIIFKNEQDFHQCGRFPKIQDLNISDIYWQVTNTSNGTFYLFNAYYDDREDFEKLNDIRILALVNRINPIVKTFCQMWFEDSNQPEIIEVYEYRMIWRPEYWDNNNEGATPYLISCKIPHHRINQIPKFVSLTEDRCEFANNAMEVKNKRPTNGYKKHFIVSVKQLDFVKDISMQLIEWLEILKILGVDKVEIFVVYAHKNVIRTLKFYNDEGFVNLKFIKFPRELPNNPYKNYHQYRHNQLICYHDTFYENINLYEFYIPMDIDEIILPIREEDKTWQDLLKRTIEKSRNDTIDYECYTAINQYFLLKNVHENETIKGIPKTMRFLSNIYRAANKTSKGSHLKTFMRTDRVMLVHNHLPIKCLKNESKFCKYFYIDDQDGFLAHYRDDCNDLECKESKLNPVKDTTLWKYKEEILRNFNKTIERLRNYKEI